MFYDMAKFQYFFNENKADVGVSDCALSCFTWSNVEWSLLRQQLVYDIERLKRHFPAVPVKIMLMDVDDDQTNL